MQASRKIIRKIERKDIDEISKIIIDVFPEDCTIIIRYVKYIYNLVKDHSYVVDIEGTVAGFSINSVEYGKGHIMYLAVRREYRRRGLGKALLCISLIHFFYELSLTEVFLEVQTENDPAIRLYESLGFRIIRRIPRYYMDGSDCYVMTITRDVFSKKKDICMSLLDDYDLHEVCSLFSKSSCHNDDLAN